MSISSVGYMALYCWASALYLRQVVAISLELPAQLLLCNTAHHVYENTTVDEWCRFRDPLAHINHKCQELNAGTKQISPYLFSAGAKGVWFDQSLKLMKS